MRGALLWLTCVVAACRNDHGVTVIVHPSAGVEQVRLYIGMGNATTTDLTDNSRVTVTDAQYWTRDPGNVLDIQTVRGGHDVTFNFNTDSTIPIVIGVGYDAQNQPIAAGALASIDPSLMRNDFTGYELSLMPADPFSATTSSPLQLGLWSPDPATGLLDASCAGLVDGSAHRYFVVLDNDQDCDGYLTTDTTNECTPDYFDGTRGGDPNAANCLVGDSIGCRLGGVPCTDGAPGQSGCSSSTTCLPTNLCDICPKSHPQDFACAADIINVAPQATVQNVAHYDCTISVDTDGKACGSVVLDRPPTGGFNCMGATIAGKDNATINGVKLTTKIDNTASCGVSLTISGNATVTDPTATTASLVEFELVNQGGIAIPAVFTFNKMPGCAPTRCILDHPIFDDPSQTRCAASWSAPTAIKIGTVDIDASDPTLTDDQLTMYFVSAGVLERTTKTMTGWSTAVPVPNVSVATIASPDLSADNAMIVFVGGDVGTGRIYLASTTAIGTSTALTYAGGSVSFTAATFMKDNPMDASGTHHLVAAGTLGAGNPQLFYVTYTGSAISLITPIDLLNPPATPDKPHLSSDGLQLYFEGVDGGKLGLYVASRRTLDEPFTYAVALEELTVGPDAIGGAWVGNGGRAMFLTATQGTSTLNHIYTSTRANL